MLKKNEKLRNKHEHSRKVVKLTKDGRPKATYQNVTSAGKYIARNVRRIYKCCNGERVSTQGYRWMFQDEYLELREKFRYFKVETN